MSEKGYLIFNFVLGVPPGLQDKDVCRGCFCNTYGISASYLDVLCALIKRGNRVTENDFDDDTPAQRREFLRELVGLADTFNIHLTPTQQAAISVPNSVASLSCFAWMHDFFNAVGDDLPNSCEIHLESMSIKDVHKEYSNTITDAGEPIIGYDSFLNLWTTCFPHVKIREYKAVSGKCKTCALLSETRRKHLSLAARRYTTQLHSFHRSMYMGERLEYYKRRNEAMLMPSEYWSAISDGMQQAHCQLPHRGNLCQSTKTLNQHLQGCIAHGRSIEIYRTFYVRNSMNVIFNRFLIF